MLLTTAFSTAALATASALAPIFSAPPQDAQGLGDKPQAVPVLVPTVPIRFGDDVANEWTIPFFEGAEYDPKVTDPRSLFGQPIGSRLASHAEILTMLRAMAATSDRVTLETYGHTFEGRELVTLTITSPANHARMEEIKSDAQRLFDPRLGSPEGVDALIGEQPGVAWMGYGIHGDETSASEAAVPFVYHLAASTDQSVLAALERVVVVLDPCLNPDGRERIRTMVEQNAGFRANLDDGSMQRGRWPGGRGNHYLFDMNRDWMAGEAPETRGRWARLLELPPQLFVDAHEMSGLDTFLFYPQAAPHNAYLPKRLTYWQTMLAGDAASVFDAFGWGYYTREWADALYPGYSDAWGSLTGAIGMLYEQGKTIGAPLERESGEIVSYRETVHGQIAASLSNLMTFAGNKDEMLADYVAHRRWAMDTTTPMGERVFAVVPSKDVTRDARFLRALLGQGIEVTVATAAFEGLHVEGTLGEHDDVRSFPAGTWIVAAAQPQGALVRAYLDLDQRLGADFLKKERESIERGHGSKIYDVTGWDLGRQFGVKGFWIDVPTVNTEAAGELLAPSGPGGRLDGAYAWVVDGADSRSLAFAARAMELGAQVHVADEDFRARVRTYGADGKDGTETLSLTRGSFLLRRHENGAAIEALVLRASQDSGAVVHGVLTGRSHDDGPDLGGGHFQLLKRPRVAMLSNVPVSRTNFGHAWSYLDQDMGVPVTLVDAQNVGRVDLSKYNVLVAPAGAGPVLKGLGEELANWVRGGGTLVAMGSSAASIAHADSGLSENRRRRDVLEELDAYAQRTERERKAYEVVIDVKEIYGDLDDDHSAEDTDAPKAARVLAHGGHGARGESADDEESGKDEGGGAADAKELDRWRRQFAPAGVILRGRVDPKMWITAGVNLSESEESQPSDLAVPFAGSTVLLSDERPAVRLASAGRLRLAGLLWPEARLRTADSAWLTVESLGRGQVISFAASPVFRGSWRGTSRLFGNAVLIGPGMTD